MDSRNKLLYILFALIQIMVSCTKDTDELLSSTADNSDAIVFGTMSGITRSVNELDAEGIKNDNFGVYAYYTGTTDWEEHEVMSTPNFMENTKVSYDKKNWSYSPIKYWPKNSQEKISYFAYAPYTSNTSYLSTTDGHPTIAYEIVDKYDDLKTERMWDLVVARNIDVSGNTTNANDKTIKFSFKHVTSRLAIKAKLSNKLTKKGSKVYISNIHVYGIYRSAKYNIATDNWIKHTVADSVDFTKHINRIDYQVNSNTTLHGVELTNNTATNIFREIPYIFMIPKNGIMRIKFNYYLVDDSTYETKTAEMTISKDFEGGHAYVLNVTFGSNGITSGEDKDDTDSSSGLDYIESNGGAYYLHHGWIWDYKEDYMFQKTSDGKFTLTLGGNPGVFFILKKQGVINYTDIYGLSYDNYAYMFDFNTTYQLVHSTNITTWSVQNMSIKETSGNNVYKFTFDPDAPSLKVEQIDPGDNTFVIPPTTQTNASMPDQLEALDGTPVSTLKNMTWYIYWWLYIDGEAIINHGQAFTNLGNGLHSLELEKLYPFQIYANGWDYTLGNNWYNYGGDELQIDVPHRLAINSRTARTIEFADGDYIENATLIIDFNNPSGPTLTVMGTPRYL